MSNRLEVASEPVPAVEIALTPTEAKLLGFLADHPGEVFSASDVFFWTRGRLAEGGEEAVVRVQMCRIRQKYEAAGEGMPVTTIRRRGYLWGRIDA